MTAVKRPSMPVTMVAIFACVTAFRECCKSVHSVENRALAGHVLQVYSDKELDACINLCDGNSQCLSVNYRVVAKHCELNDRSFLTNPEDSIPVEDTVYIDNLHRTTHPCIHSSCRNGGRCIVTSSIKGYACRCTGGYHGEHCQECGGIPVGMESRVIPNEYITASTHTSDGYPSYGRLNRAKGWQALANDTHNPYFQVRFTSRKLVVSLATQGFEGNLSTVSRTTGYFLSYSQDGRSWKDYHALNESKTPFVGNDASSTTTRHWLNNPFKAFYIRLWPTNWDKRPALRMELYGCDAYH